MTTLQDTVIIVIHGTWAHQHKLIVRNHWYKPGGLFFDSLNSSYQHHAVTVVPFIWSGRNDHNARVLGAQLLADTIEQYPETTKIIIVAHSHGTNVGFLASQKLALLPHNHHRITQFFSFGAPINTNFYAPNMDVIAHLYNFFSYKDLIQPVLGMFEREILPLHERVANIRITIDGHEPDHHTLHHVTVAKWLSQIHAFLSTLDIFSFTTPGIIHFTHLNPPEYKIDHERLQRREQDLKFMSSIIMALRSFSQRVKIKRSQK